MKFQKITVTVLFACIITIPLARLQAQALNDYTGKGFLIGIASGTYPLAGYGYSVLLTADSGAGYQLYGIYNVNDNYGAYSFTNTSLYTTEVTMNDYADGIVNKITLNYSGANQGGFNNVIVSPPGYSGLSQSGQFGVASGTALGSIAGRNFNCNIRAGNTPFAGSGAYTISFSANGSSYNLIGSGGVINSSGTCSYSVFNRSTAIILLSDSVSGTTKVFVGFTNSSSGTFALKSLSYTGGFQIGDFSLSDPTPPSTAITTPGIGQSTTNSFIQISGTAADNVQVTNVYCRLNAGSWTQASSSDGWTNWIANFNLTPGTNQIQVYSIDSSGNVSATVSRSVFLSVPASVGFQVNGFGTITPNYNGQMLEIGKSYFISAIPNPGYIFVGWTGDIASKSPNLTFLMASNLAFEANFKAITTPPVKLTVALAVSKQAGSNVVGTVSSTASPTLSKLATKDLLNLLAYDKHQQGLWLSNSFPSTASLGLVSETFFVMNGTNLLSNVSDIMSFELGEPKIQSGKQDVNTGLASTTKQKLQLANIVFDDTFINGGNNLNFYLYGILALSTTDNVPANGVYTESQALKITPIVGDGYLQGVPITITGSISGTGKGVLQLTN